MQHFTIAYGGFQILSFQNSLLILYLMEKYIFNSSVHQTLATTYENCCFILCFFLLARFLKDSACRYTLSRKCGGF